jgi:hypothetical protein
MDFKVGTLWLKALKSGAFEHGKGFLCVGDRYCALGLLSAIGGIQGICSVVDHDDYNEPVEFGGAIYCIDESHPVAVWADLCEKDIETVAELSDSEDDFSAVIVWLENELKYL